MIRYSLNHALSRAEQEILMNSNFISQGFVVDGVDVMKHTHVACKLRFLKMFIDFNCKARMFGRNHNNGATCKQICNPVVWFTLSRQWEARRIACDDEELNF